MADSMVTTSDVGIDGCSRCHELCITIRIQSPSELTHALRVVRDNLQDGTLVESSYWPNGKLKLSNEPFSAISETGPWPDHIVYYFACAACGQLFKLSAETYHGLGGSWSPCDGSVAG